MNHEDYDETDGEFTLKITATDRYVTAPGEDEDPTTGSASQSIKITVKDITSGDGGDGPVPLQTIGDWWVTVDDNLDAEDVRDGDWLSFGLDTTGDNAAFTDEDEDDLTYMVSVVDSDGSVVDWLQISDSGKMTNVADMLPERGVYTVTVTATDGDNSAQTSFKLAVALSDANDRDNDTPDIRDVEEFPYTEGFEPQKSHKVASFSVRDDDVAIAPHPYGVLDVDFTATQEGTNVKNRLKVMEVGRDEDSVHYEIHTKSAEELFVKDAEGEYKLDADDEKIPIDPLDFEDGDEVDITVTVTDGRDETDDKDITFDIEDAADAAATFDEASIADDEEDARWSVSRKPDAKNNTGTTTITVDQEQAKVVIVVQLFEVWTDPDTDVDELNFSVGGRGSLDDDWISVYGPDEWEEIYDRRGDVNSGDGASSVRDGDQVVVIVIDRSAMGDNEGLTGGSFTVTAKDDEGNSATETIAITVDNVNVDIAKDDGEDVVTIVGDPSGTEPLEMDVNLALDPDLDDANDAVLVVYTWSHDNATPEIDTDDVTISVTSTNEDLAIADREGDAIYGLVGTTFKATVHYYEMDPDTGAIIENGPYSATTDDPTVAPEERVVDPGVSIEVTTDATGLQVDITAVGAAQSASGATGNVRLQASENGESGWINVDTGDADTNDGLAENIDLNVDANADDTDGDGGGLYYQVVYSYTVDDETKTEIYDVGQLGNLIGGDPTATDPAGNIIGGNEDNPIDNPDVGETLRVATAGEDADVQWQSAGRPPRGRVDRYRRSHASGTGGGQRPRGQ